MNVFYNAEGVGDTLLISLKDVTREEVGHETFGDVVRIFNQETKETTGFNIFNASTYMKIEENGSVPLSETIVQDINEILNRNGVSETLTVDLSPKFVVGYVKEKEKHPNADKLNICQVDVGDETLQIVCGAPNVDQGQYVVVAKVGAVMPSGMVIKDAELRGVPSSGMICSAKELDLPDAPAEKGILVFFRWKPSSWRTL
ncbi:putative tRNA-binding protein YtpR [Bacillus safensis]|uniref:Putative tRNA-binding protein YtpR n=1 Tax=Bacillus safensis TaxID=561879 RepID=A0A5S9MJ35_BACIA|nr:putative tRNA-binding protein YtpR [Bacillus safensis]